jgi:hypothetical protein
MVHGGIGGRGGEGRVANLQADVIVAAVDDLIKRMLGSAVRNIDDIGIVVFYVR